MYKRQCITSGLVDRSQSVSDNLLYLDFCSNLFSLSKQSLSHTLDHKASQSSGNIRLNKPTLIYSLPQKANFEITSFAAFAPPSKSIKNLVLGTSNGNLILISPSGEILKSIENIHLGSVTYLQFSSDGHSFISAGEDGGVKLWSTSGMLRKKVANLKAPITSFHWSLDTSLLAVGTPNKITIIHFLTNNPNISLNLDSENASSPASPCFCVWSPCSRFLLLGSELCRFMLISSSGECLLQSETYSLPFENGGWLPSSKGFLVSSQNQILCSDIHGKIFSQKKFDSKNSIMNITLSENKTEALILHVNGNINSLPLLLLTPLYFRNFEVKTGIEDYLIITNTTTSYSENLDIKASQISAIDCNFGYMAVIVQDKLMVYDLENPLTPNIQDFTGVLPNFLSISNSCILVSCPPQLFLFSFSGKTLSILSLPVSVSNSGLSESSISVCAESIFLLGKINKNLLIFFVLIHLQVLKYLLMVILLKLLI